MRLFFIGLFFFLILLAQSTISEKAFRARGLDLAQSSFELGCLNPMVHACREQYMATDMNGQNAIDYGACLDTSQSICRTAATDFRQKFQASAPK